MAKIKKLSSGGELFYPAAIYEAIVNKDTNKTLAADLLTLVKSVNSGSTTPDAALAALTALGTGYNSLVAVATTLKDFLTGATNSNETIDRWKEVESFLAGITDTQTLTGLMEATLQKAKEYADGKEFTLKKATSSELGGVKLGSDTVQTVAANSPSATASRTYPVQENSAGQAVVNVPWEAYNNATTSAAGLMSADDKKKLEAFNEASEYIMAANATDTTEYPEITI